MGITSAWGISPHEDTVIRALAPRMQPLIDSVRALPESRAAWARWACEPLPDWRSWYDLGADPDRDSDPDADGEGEREADRAERRRVHALVDSFLDLTRAGRFDEFYAGKGSEDDFRAVDDLWRVDPGALMTPFVAVQTKDYAVPALFHAIGSDRAALIPGWVGNFLLSAAQVRRSLPGIEAAFSFAAEERAAAEDQLWLDEAAKEESVLDGPLRCWREAAAHDLGLCGIAVHIW